MTLSAILLSNFPSMDSGEALARKGEKISAIYPPAHPQGVFLGVPPDPLYRPGT